VAQNPCYRPTVAAVAAAAANRIL